ncbi:HesA/MoeB/ThiF family protein [Flavobacteriaceae bacterium]|nr:HesA/MoeB/ThiF family protein [Flavobacteriaceae bacterium]
MLSNQQEERYLRNILLKEIDLVGQKKLLNAKVLIIGAGGLGSSVIYYLSAAGIGCLGVMDHDHVDLSNLQRQIIHNVQDIKKSKAISVKEKINLLNPEVEVIIYQEKAYHQNLKKIVKDYDLIVDATDNFQSRFLINKVCHNSQKPLISAAVKAFSGQIYLFKSYQKNNPCYECFNPSNQNKIRPLSLAEKGIFGGVAGVLGSLQAINIVKEILQIGESLLGKIMIFDFLTNKTKVTNLSKNKNCQICCD